MNHRKESKPTAITIRIEPTIYEWIAEQAQKEKRSLNAQIALLLERAYEQDKSA